MRVGKIQCEEDESVKSMPRDGERMREANTQKYALRKTLINASYLGYASGLERIIESVVADEKGGENKGTKLGV